MPVPYLRSKLLAPRLHEDVVERPRLVERLAASSAAVWLVSAPAGYGKTTVVSQAVAEADAHVGWVSVDRADNDPVRFWTHVATALMGEGETLDGLAELTDPERMDAAVDRILAHVEGREERVVLVLDDLHEITEPAITEILGRVVIRPPANLTIAITARYDPALPIGRLRSHGQLAELRAPDLAFTLHETEAILAGVDPDTLALIAEQTEGWATALRMLAVTTAGSNTTEELLEALTREHRDLGDFLAAETLASLRPELQRFLVETSILEDLCPDSCDAVTGRSGSLALLRELARSQVFTELVDPPSDTYRYHRVFREFLRSRAEELEPGRLQQLHRAAAGWYTAADNPTATIRHALAAGDDELAMSTIKGHYGAFAQAGLLTTVNDWLEAYGLDRCRRDTELQLAAAWAALNARRFDDIDAWLDPTTDDDLDRNFRVQAHTIRSHRARHRGDLATALDEGGLAVEIADTRDPSLPDRSIAYAALVMAQQLARTVDPAASKAAVDLGRHAANDSSIVIGYSALALAASHDPERLGEAEAFAGQALAFATSPLLERFHQPMAALLAKSRVALGRGRPADAETLAERAEAIAQDAAAPLMSALVRCQLARVAHVQGQPDQARRHLRDAESVLGDEPPDPIVEEIRRARNESRFARAGSSGPVELSERERAVLRLLPHGLSRKDLAAQLFVSENTIKSHLTSLRHKLGVTGRRADIVARALELGLIDDDTAAAT
jgi:LuxR family maltose regulon positive regulatory protein